jgi:hypothetical protein
VQRELRRLGTPSLGVVRQYLRHAPEFRALKALLRYDVLRRLVHRVARAPAG